MKGRSLPFLVAAALASILVLPPGAQASGRPFHDVAHKAGVAEVTRTFSVSVTDYNADGRDDPMIVRHGPQKCCPDPRLYRNKGGGSFVDIRQKWGHSDKHDCTWGDFNKDGRRDVFCAVGLGPFSVNELWKQRSDGSFANVAAAQGLTRPRHGRYRAATFIDANDDGWPDIYVARYAGSDFGGPGGYLGDNYPNELWINKGPGNGFHLAPGWGLNVKDSAPKDSDSCNQDKDFNRDGRRDLILCSPFGFRLYKNKGSRFVNVAKAKNVGGKFFDAAWANFNKDDRLDLVQVKEKRVRVMLQTPGGSFVQSYGKGLAAGQNVGTGDINGDGSTDVWVVASCPRGKTADKPDYLLLNRGAGGFRAHRQPSLSRGCGDAVTSRFDYNQDGKADFLVANGRKKVAGPVQLFTWAR